MVCVVASRCSLVGSPSSCGVTRCARLWGRIALLACVVEGTLFGTSNHLMVMHILLGDFRKLESWGLRVDLS